MATAGGLSASDVHILAEFLDLTPPSSSVSTPAPTPTPTPLPVEVPRHYVLITYTSGAVNRRRGYLLSGAL